MLYYMKYTSSWAEFEITILAVVDTDCKDSCKSNYHTIKNTTTPHSICMQKGIVIHIGFMFLNIFIKNAITKSESLKY
jgi:hypothetical protein